MLNVLNAQKKLLFLESVLEKELNFPLEYATIVFENNITNNFLGGITDENGNFKFEINAGKYNARAEFISLKQLLFKKNFNSDTNLGV